MDTGIDAKELVKRILREYAEIKPSYGDVEVETIFDDDKGHYEVMRHGWDEWRRIHGCVIHIDIRGDKIIIQHDGTPWGMADELMEAGIPPERIVIGFHQPSQRKHTKFAVS